MVHKMRYLILSLSFISIISFADDHTTETTFPGLVSTESFNLGNGMEMHVERRNSCNQDGTPKHFHPAAGTLVYVLDGKSQSKSSGEWKEYNKNEYWFERSDWVHGGEADTPSLPEGTCQQLLVIRVAEEGKEHTIFID
tara:strand:- start:150 stop:566 length:417 start_codon:yes stop_codon:yes gene_type:complete